VFQVTFDFIDHNLKINTSDGASRAMALVPRSVADFYAEFMDHLVSLGVRVSINTRPVEVDNEIPFDEDHVHKDYDPLYAHRCWRILVGVARPLEQ